MTNLKLDSITTGIPVLDEAFVRWKEAIEAAYNVSAVHPLTISSERIISLRAQPKMDVKLTSAAGTPGSYNAVQVYPSAGAGWTPYPSASGWSGVVWEYNLFASVTLPAYTEAEYEPVTGDWRFQLGGCS